jgi:hypothetical protein
MFDQLAMWICFLGRYDEPNSKKINTLGYTWLDELMTHSW